MSNDVGFAPEPLGWFGITFFRRVKAVVCLECGSVNQYLTRADVEKLRQKYSKGEPPPD